MELKNLFSPWKIGNVPIKNRIVRSATYERRATKYGYVSDELIKLYTNLARGGAGLIITGAVAIDPRGTGGPYQSYLYDDSYLKGQKQLVDAVHDYSDVRIAIQIFHPGRQGTHPRYPPVAPSPILCKATNRVPKELTVEEIKEIVKCFVNVGRRAYESGYDMVQMHGCHDYLLSNFISPLTNKRTDNYGGNPEKRSKILIDLFNHLRDEVGKNFPIIIKLQTQDEIPGGLTLEEAKKTAKILVDTGYDAIEPSGGSIDSISFSKNPLPSKLVKSTEDENYLLPTAKVLKLVMNDCPLILVGGIKNPLSAEKILREKHAEFVSMCRPFIYEPDLPKRWKSGDLSPAKCVSCNSCYMTMMAGSVHCVVKKRLEKKRLRKEKNSKKGT